MGEIEEKRFFSVLLAVTQVIAGPIGEQVGRMSFRVDDLVILPQVIVSMPEV